MAKKGKKAAEEDQSAKSEGGRLIDRASWEASIYGELHVFDPFVLPRPKMLDLIRGPSELADASPTILTLDVELKWSRFARGPWTCVIEMPSDAILWDLHEVVRAACDFDDDHQFGFYLASSDRGSRHWLNAIDDEPMDLRLDEIWPLKKHYKLHYLYDYGDSWTFQVRRQRKPAFLPEAESEYPRIVSIAGKRLIQYPGDKGTEGIRAE
jgi:hypothetical protein